MNTDTLRIVDEGDRPPPASRAEQALQNAIDTFTASVGREPSTQEALDLANRIKSRTLDAIVEQADARPDWQASSTNDIPGDVFGVNVPEAVPAIWGGGEYAYWSEGELAIMYGGDGTNKTSLTHNVIAGMLDFPGYSEVIGQPVRPIDHGEQILYLAFDRPRQIERSWSRFMRPEYAARTAGRIVWRTEALPFDAQRRPLEVAEWIAAQYPAVRYVVFDNVWDAFGDFAEPANATSAGIALNNVARSGVHTLALHHDRKSRGGAATKPPETHDNMYGGRNFAAKAGSIVNVWKSPTSDGSSIVVTQMKEPSERIAPQTLYVQQRTGTFIRLDDDSMTLAKLLQMEAPQWVEITAAAKVHRHTEKPTDADKEATRRALASLVDSGEAERRGKSGDTPANAAAAWRWSA